MTYDPYKEIDVNMVAKLGFPYSACNYVYYSEKQGRQLGTLYKTDEGTFDQIRDILRGNNEVNIKEGDRVYILPGHPLAHTRIKEYLKSIGANTTKSLSAATVIAGCEDFYEDMTNNYDGQAKYASLMIYAEEIYQILTNDEDQLEGAFHRLNGDNDTAGLMYHRYLNDVECIVSNKTHVHIGFNANIDLVKDVNMITPAGMEVIYYVLAKGLKVLTQDTVADNANSGLKLADEDTFLSIHQMLNSGDKKNQSLGVDIMTHCDLGGDIMYTAWRLASKFKREVDSADNTKGLSYFQNKVDWHNLTWLNSREFINHAHDKNNLKAKVVKDLMPKIFKNMKDDSPIKPDDDEQDYEADEFFECIIDEENISYTIQLKEKWKKILKQKDDDAARF